MIQRIQTIYLLLVAALLISSMCLPVGYFMGPDAALYTLKPLGIQVGEVFNSTWGMFGILLLSTIIALCSVFLFKNRMLQIRMSIFNTILLVGYYLTFLAFIYVLKDDLDASYRLAWSLCLPLVAIIFNILAIRAIGRDEVMVRTADRLR
ncbi:DUF4293 domain-containing protein [Bacteroides sp.]|uniref:DUF4293 domain-containing protein n=1 Tax=Bacteroides sp. TaxID=29523 RepID=UPI001B7C5995|nr:DUF4293 domain-containing protein [Bacteroides sp.]MBP6064656.1 DUF4293 domain-containing protein [Bacteroides sp.]MBP6935881.1 DUF4293 domain-containing protein [Bacteroides sp.]MBP8621887.1 DUF4293 domain-containing protein [Bacteroides sp.]